MSHLVTSPRTMKRMIDRKLSRQHLHGTLKARGSVVLLTTPEKRHVNPGGAIHSVVEIEKVIGIVYPDESVSALRHVIIQRNRELTHQIFQEALRATEAKKKAREDNFNQQIVEDFLKFSGDNQ